MTHRLAHRARARAEALFGPSALVLTYHRVTDLERDPQLLAVSPANFEAQVALLAERYRPMPLADLLDALSNKRIPGGAVSITFDDGYEDNLTAALPILEHYRTPATVFVSSGYLDAGREFWWDEIEGLILDDDCAGTWNVLRLPENDCQAEYLTLMDRLRVLDSRSREAAIAEVRQHLGVLPTVRPSHRPMSARQVAELDASSLIEVGAHSLEHDILSLLPEEKQHRSILQDKERLQAICKRDIRFFSYPYGGREDYSEATMRIVREAGFAGACANHPGLTKPWTDPFQLPRMVVRDWGAQEFIQRIEDWFAGRKGAQ